MSDPTAEKDTTGLNGTPPPRPSRKDEILEVSPLHKEVCKDLMWAEIQYAAGAFQPYSGKCLGIVEKTILSDGYDPGEVREAAAAKAGVILARVALFHVDDGGSW